MTGAAWAAPADRGTYAPAESAGRLAYSGDGGQSGGDLDIFFGTVGLAPVLFPGSTPGGNEVDPSVSPGGAKLAWSGNADGDADIYVANSDGTGIVNITPARSGSGEGDPSFSPNGQRIAWTSGDSNADIFTSNIDGTGLRNNTQSGFEDRDPSWTSDGKLLFRSLRGTQTEVILQDSVGNETNLTAGYNQTVRDPVASPDGKLIAFTSFADARFDTDIFVMNSDGTGIRDITADSMADEESPVFSVGSSSIFYAKSDFTAEDIWSSPAAGGFGTNLTDNVAGSAASPDPEFVYSCAGQRATIVGSGVGDDLRGTEAADVILALGGDDGVFAGGGDDTICMGDGFDEVFGEAGNDTVLGGTGPDDLDGGNGKDNLSGEGGKDKLSGSKGKDKLSGAGGKDRLSGGKGKDKLLGGPGKDSLNGGPQKDKLKGGPGKDKEKQ